MTDEVHRLAIDGAAINRAARISAAMAYHFRGRAVHAAERTGAVVVRMLALRGLRPGVGAGALPRAMVRSLPYRDEREAAVGRGGLHFLQPRAAREIARRSTVPRNAGLDTGIVSVVLRPKMMVTRAVSAPAPTAIGRGGKLSTQPRLSTFILAQNRRYGLARPITATMQMTALRGSQGVARILARSVAAYREQTFLAPSSPARRRQSIAVSSPQRSEAPGFHRTVRQARTAAKAGDVFLDKHLVGYHLAAAITAEQTRAAARPNSSGSAFNSSMAVLRPSGAGL